MKMSGIEPEQNSSEKAAETRSIYEGERLAVALTTELEKVFGELRSPEQRNKLLNVLNSSQVLEVGDGKLAELAGLDFDDDEIFKKLNEPNIRSLYELLFRYQALHLFHERLSNEQITSLNLVVINGVSDLPLSGDECKQQLSSVLAGKPNTARGFEWNVPLLCVSGTNREKGILHA